MQSNTPRSAADSDQKQNALPPLRDQKSAVTIEGDSPSPQAPSPNAPSSQRSRGSLRSIVRRVSASVKLLNALGSSTDKEKQAGSFQQKEKQVREMKVSLDQKKKNTQAVIKAMEEQEERWKREDFELSRYLDVQRKKLDRIMTLVGGEVKYLARDLTPSEIENLLKMKREVEHEMVVRQNVARETREKEGKLELTAEQKCVLYGLEAAKKVRGSGRRVSLSGNFSGMQKPSGSNLVKRQESQLDGAEANEDPSVAIASTERIGERIGRSDAELKKTALEKNAQIAAYEERWEAEYAEHRQWMSTQMARLEEIVSETTAARLDAQGTGRALTDEEKAKEDQSDQLRQDMELRDWQYRDRKKWEKAQLPSLTDDERRVLRGMDSAKKIKQQRRSTASIKAERASTFAHGGREESPKGSSSASPNPSPNRTRGLSGRLGRRTSGAGIGTSDRRASAENILPMPGPSRRSSMGSAADNGPMTAVSEEAPCFEITPASPERGTRRQKEQKESGPSGGNSALPSIPSAQMAAVPKNDQDRGLFTPGNFSIGIDMAIEARSAGGSSASGDPSVHFPLLDKTRSSPAS